MTTTSHSRPNGEKSWAQLLDEAVRMRPTDIQGSIAQLRVLSQVRFAFQPRAQQYLAVALYDTGQYDESQQILNTLLSEHPEPTSFTRENCCFAAQVALTLGQYETANQHIRDAKHIASQAFDVVANGRLRQLEGIISAKQGESDRALEKMVSGRRMTQVHRAFQETTGQSIRGLVPIT